MSDEETNEVEETEEPEVEETTEDDDTSTESGWDRLGNLIDDKLEGKFSAWSEALEKKLTPPKSSSASRGSQVRKVAQPKRKKTSFENWFTKGLRD